MSPISRFSDSRFVRGFTLHCFLLFVGVLAVMMAACQPDTTTTQALPTLAVLPTETPTEVPTQTATLFSSDTPAPTLTPSVTLTLSPTPFPSDTPAPTARPSVTPQLTQAAASTATQAILQAPTFATFTPPAPGTLPPPGTPQQVADVIITRQQFQDAVNLQIPNYPTIQSAQVHFVPEGIQVELTALGGQAFITGNVLLSIEISNGVAAISPTDITVNAAEPPDAYVDVVNNDFFSMMIAVLDSILKARLGPDQDLQNIVLSGDNMLITLLVPQK